jgi:hypothetical protein
VTGDGMSFFENITTMEIIGLILIAAGALINFLSARIAGLIQSNNKYMQIIIKFIGLGLVAVAFFMILGM